jgi:adenosylcobinamide-phosphate synthase
MIPPVLQIYVALLLDQLLGDPRWLPHPIRLIGWFATVLERFFRTVCPSSLKLAGILTVTIMVGTTANAVICLLQVTTHVHPALGTLCGVIIMYTSFAARDLWKHSQAVYKALNSENLEDARCKVGLIVGRDTADLSEKEVARAAVESVAESLVDGVTAPLFYAFLFGPTGAMAYKAINTADSMFGYKNERYREFGWAGARLDDLANFIPARITAFLIPVAAFLLGLNGGNSWRILLRDRKSHASPNSGHTESAVAGALEVQLGGSNIYFGKVVKKPTIGDDSQQITPKHILLTNRLMLVTTILATLILTPFSVIIMCTS